VRGTRRSAVEGRPNPGKAPHEESRTGPTDDAYAILGVPFDADDTEIASAYRSLARRYHPDIAGETATSRMSVINAAFDLLRDSRRRDEYDRALDAADAATGRPGSRAARRRVGRTRSAARPGATGTPAEGAGSRGTAGDEGPRATYGWGPERDGTGGAGRPPGRASGSVLDFGRHVDWSIGEIARLDPGYLEWLEGRPEGRPYLDEIDETLVRIGFRSIPKRPQPAAPSGRRRGSR
jgi:curved DNA-binding protein CbpA